MVDITTSEYFFNGSADCEGNTNYAQYGLYEPFSNRFVLVSKFPDALRRVATLFSGRVSLRLCQLHSAVNFESKLIDNTCCTSWTIENLSGYNALKGYREHINMDIFNVKRLGPAESLNEPELIIDNIEYLMATYHWVNYSEREYSLMHITDPFVSAELELNSHVSLPLELSPTSLATKELHDIIFTEPDFNIAKLKVEKILGNYK